MISLKDIDVFNDVLHLVKECNPIYNSCLLIPNVMYTDKYTCREDTVSIMVGEDCDSLFLEMLSSKITRSAISKIKRRLNKYNLGEVHKVKENKNVLYVKSNAYLKSGGSDRIKLHYIIAMIRYICGMPSIADKELFKKSNSKTLDKVLSLDSNELQDIASNNLFYGQDYIYDDAYYGINEFIRTLKSLNNGKFLPALVKLLS